MYRASKRALAVNRGSNWGVPLPRSGKRLPTSWPCSVCAKDCGNDSICCETCKCWVHAGCESLKTGDLGVLSGKYPYTCTKCIERSYGGSNYNYVYTLGRLREAARYSFGHLRVISQREKTLLPALLLVDEVDRDLLRVDNISMAYMAATKPTDCDKGLQPCHTSADGNCLFNALSIAVCGDERYSTEFRVRTCVEMAINETYYASQPFGDDFQYVAPDYQDASVETAKNGQHANAWTIQAACNVLGRTITALYPTENGVNDPVAAMLTRQHIPRAPVTTEAPVNIMWTRTTQRYDLTKTWLPNHFVPVIAMYTDDSSSETFSSRSSTPVKNDGGVATMELDESNIQLATGVKGVDLSEFQYDALRQADTSCRMRNGLDAIPTPDP